MSVIRRILVLTGGCLALAIGLAACDQAAEPGGETPPSQQQPGQQ